MVAWFTVLVPEVLTLAGMVVVVLAVDLTLGLVALAVAPPLALVVALRRRRIRAAQRASRDADAALASEATEVLRNVRVVQAFTREGEAGREARRGPVCRAKPPRRGRPPGSRGSGSRNRCGRGSRSCTRPAARCTRSARSWACPTAPCAPT